MANIWLEAINELSKSKRIPTEVIKDNLIKACKSSYENEYLGREANISFDMDKGEFTLSNVYKVVEDSKENDEDFFDDLNMMTLSQASKLKPGIKVGDSYEEIVKNDSIEPSVWQNTIRLWKKMNSSESNKKTFLQWKDKKGQIIKKNLESFAGNIGLVKLDENENVYGEISGDNLIQNEKLISGNEYVFYVEDVVEQGYDFPIRLSRTSEKILEWLLKNSIPEIADGTITVKTIARLPGWRSKIIVSSSNPNIDPIGTIVGPSGSRINGICQQLSGERIDVIKDSDDFERLLTSILAPAEIISYMIEDGEEEGSRKRLTIVATDENSRNIIKSIRLYIQLLNMSVEVINPNDVANLKLSDADFKQIDYTKYPIVHQKKNLSGTPGQKPAYTPRPQGSFNKREGGTWTPTGPKSSLEEMNKGIDDITSKLSFDEEDDK